MEGLAAATIDSRFMAMRLCAMLHPQQSVQQSKYG